MEGCVITEELNTEKLEAGVICVLKNDENTLRICTIQHIDPSGHWVVTGADFENYPVPLKAELCRLVVITDRGIYPLKFNQWKKAIQNKEVGTEKRVSFELIPAVFKEGKYVKDCRECTAQFLGNRSQTECKECCDKDVTAKIIINKSIKPKRPRVKSVIDIKALALTSFQMGSPTPKSEDEIKTFNKWLDKQF
jgi:hypothetical protein